MTALDPSASKGDTFPTARERSAAFKEWATPADRMLERWAAHS